MHTFIVLIVSLSLLYVPSGRMIRYTLSLSENFPGDFYLISNSLGIPSNSPLIFVCEIHHFMSLVSLFNVHVQSLASSEYRLEFMIYGVIRNNQGQQVQVAYSINCQTVKAVDCYIQNSQERLDSRVEVAELVFAVVSRAPEAKRDPQKFPPHRRVRD